MTALTIGTLVLEKGTQSNDFGWLEQDRCVWLVADSGWMLNDGKAEDPGAFVRSAIAAHADTKALWRQGARERGWDVFNLWTLLCDGKMEHEPRLWEVLWQEYRLAIHPYLTKVLIPHPIMINPAAPEYRVTLTLDDVIPAEKRKEAKVLRPGMTLLVP